MQTEKGGEMARETRYETEENKHFTRLFFIPFMKTKALYGRESEKEVLHIDGFPILFLFHSFGVKYPVSLMEGWKPLFLERIYFLLFFFGSPSPYEALSIHAVDLF